MGGDLALQLLQRQIASHGGTVLGVNFRDTTGDANAFARKYGLTYPSLRDVGLELAQDYSTHALPETFVIDRRGMVRDQPRPGLRAFLTQRGAAAAS